MNHRRKRILLWDQSGERSKALAEALMASCGQVSIVEDFDKMIQALTPNPQVDLVIADLDTVRRKGKECLELLRPPKSLVPLALATDRRSEEYISDIRALHLHHVLVKIPPLDPHEVSVIVDCAIQPMNGFGLAHHFSHTLEMYSLTTTSRRNKNEVVERVINHFATNGYEIHELYDVRLILEELINNAFFHAFRDQRGAEKYHLSDFEGLTLEESVRVDFGNAGDVVGFAVTDNAGTLEPDMILGKLERQYMRHGIFDESGRGLYISRMLASSLFFNIHEHHRTQVVAIFREKDRKQRLKPMVINYTPSNPVSSMSADQGKDRFHTEVFSEPAPSPSQSMPIQDLHEDFD